jgi:hypothetical protein
MTDFYFILFLKRLYADEKLQYFQLSYIPCRMVSGNDRIFTLCRMITWVVFLRMFLKFYQQLIGKERRIPFIFDDFHFCRSRVIGLDMTKNRI